MEKTIVNDCISDFEKANGTAFKAYILSIIVANRGYDFLESVTKDKGDLPLSMWAIKLLWDFADKKEERLERIKKEAKFENVKMAAEGMLTLLSVTSIMKPNF